MLEFETRNWSLRRSFLFLVHYIIFLENSYVGLNGKVFLYNLSTSAIASLLIFVFLNHHNFQYIPPYAIMLNASFLMSYIVLNFGQLMLQGYYCNSGRMWCLPSVLLFRYPQNSHLRFFIL